MILLLLAGLRPTEGLPRWSPLESVSAYYYTGAVAAFVGLLVALALFLFTYRGYDNKYGRLDRIAAVTAGVAALGVAFFPTHAPPPLTVATWWSPVTGVLHYVFAVILFTMFAVFSLWLFRLTEVGVQPAEDKVHRNRIYMVCGLVIVGSMIWVVVARIDDGDIFVPETVALTAFAVSWLVKGYAHRTIAGAARSLVN